MDDVPAIPQDAGDQTGARTGSAPTDRAAPDAHQHFVASALLVGGLTFLSRLGGLLRDAVAARVFGTGAEMTAFGLAFLIPNLFRKLFGEGALSAAFIPEYTKSLKADESRARAFARRVLTVSVLALLGITLLLEVVLVFLIEQGVGADSPESGDLVYRLSLVMVPYMPLVCMVALIGGVLQVHGRFGVTAAAPVLLNVIMVAATVAFAIRYPNLDNGPLDTGVRWLAWSVIVAGLLQLGMSWFSYSKLMSTLRPPDLSAAASAESRERIRDMLRMLGPMVIGLGVVQANAFLDGVIAGYPSYVGPTIFGIPYPLDTASFSIVAIYTSRLYQFPLGVFGVAIATAIFPRLARHADNSEQLAATLREGVRFAFFITLPSAIGLMFVGIPLAAVVYEGSKFSHEDTLRVANVLIGYAPSVIGFSLIGILGRAFFALGDTKTPMRLSVGMVIVDFVMNITFIWPMGEAGLSWSTSASALIQTVALFLLLRRHRIERIIDDATRRSCVSTLISAGIMTLSIVVLKWTLPTESPEWVGRFAEVVHLPSAWFDQFCRLVAIVLTGAVTFGAAAHFQGQPELGWVLKRKTGAPRPWNRGQ